MLLQFVCVGLGSALGGCLRYAIFLFSPCLSIWNLLFVNVIASFLFGIFSHTQGKLYLLFVVGFLGAFSTFSSFSYEVSTLLQKKQIIFAGLYVALSLFLALFAFALGERIS